MIHVVIPSKTRLRQREFLKVAIASVRAQGKSIDIVVVVDQPLEIDGARVLVGPGGQAAAMNHGASGNSEYLAFLEDDDIWAPWRVKAALDALQECDFTSSTQLEIDQEGVVRITDFPTPSGWFMKREVWEKVGGMNTDYRWHLDNEWLGRLGRSDFKRRHLVECTAPVSVNQTMPYRPWLKNICTVGGMNSTLYRHISPYPLVERLVHPHSGMGIIARDREASERSWQETQQLMRLYGYNPC